MKSEVIFQFTTSWRGRYEDEHSSEIVISADFSGAAGWPYSVREFQEVSEYDYPNGFQVVEPRHEVRCDLISKEVFDRIKRYIAGNTELKNCKEHLENDVMDGGSENFFFGCDSYTKQIGGLSVRLCGHYESEGPSYRRTGNYTVYQAVNEIDRILSELKVSLF